jgi:predicted secreted protein
MSTTGTIIVFIVSWWLFFFMTLPFGVKPPAKPAPGTEPAAPDRPLLLWKAVASTVLAAAITWGLNWAIATGRIAVLPQ